MHGAPDGPQCLILRLLRSRTQPRELGSCYRPNAGFGSCYRSHYGL